MPNYKRRPNASIARRPSACVHMVYSDAHIPPNLLVTVRIFGTFFCWHALHVGPAWRKPRQKLATGTLTYAAQSRERQLLACARAEWFFEPARSRLRTRGSHTQDSLHHSPPQPSASCWVSFVQPIIANPSRQVQPAKQSHGLSAPIFSCTADVALRGR